jgi:Zn-dependent protease
MEFRYVDIFFQAIVFLFAISVHESAHAWMANRCGDPTAKMLGRVTLNPLKHIDPIGTVLLPAIGLISGAGIFGWAKPTPVTTSNFKHEVRDDVFTTVAGPASNLLIAGVSVVCLTAIAYFTVDGKEYVQNIADGALTDTDSLWMPVIWLLYSAVRMNLLLFVFNLIPVPPLDGSHVLRHMLPDSVRNIYDSVGMFGILLLFTMGGPLVGALVRPFLNFVNNFLVAL